MGAVSGLIAFLLGQMGWLGGIDAGAYDLAMRGRPPLSAPPEVVVAVIDDRSISKLGRWPWPWTVHAEFVEAVSQRYRPAAIVFDVLFAEHDARDAEHTFARAVGEAGNVYLAAYFAEGAEAERPSPEAPWLPAEYTGSARWQGKRFPAARPPSPELARAAAGVGPVNVVPELDGCVRRVPLVLDYEGTPYPSLLAVVANSLVNTGGKPVQVALGRAITLGSYRVPIDGAGETLVSYHPDPAALPGRLFRHHGYEEVLSGKVAPRELRGKVVLVGFGATGMADVHPTPLTPGAFGVDISAQALNGILHGSFVRAAGWPARLMLAVGLGLVVSLIATGWSPARALAIGLLVVVGAAGLVSLVLWSRGVWMGAAAPAIAALCGYSLTVAQRYRESERRSLRVQAGVDTLARATRVIGSVRQRSELLEEIRAQVTEVMEARQTNVYLMDETRQRLERAGGEAISHAVGEGMVGWVAREGDGHLIERLEPGSEAEREVSGAVRFAAGSVIYAPLRVRGQVTGVVEVVRQAGGAPFGAEHLTLLSALAAEAAVALENTVLYEQLAGKVEIANRELVSAYGELRQERDRVAAMVSSMADGVVVTDEESRIAFMNPAAAEMFGVQAEEVEGRAVQEALPHAALLEQLGEEAAETAARIPMIRLAEPRRLILSPKTVRLVDESGARRGAITVVTDVTLLQELSEMKTEFVSLVSHELRTPLTAIMGFAQTVKGLHDTLPMQEREEYLGIIEQESYRLLVMINDLLDVSRMEAGRALAMNRVRVNLRELAEHVVRFQQVSTRRHEFRLDFPEEGLWAEADRDKVVQILTNLVSNAIKYSPKGGEIGITGAEEDDEAVVRVSDHGLGMTPEQMGQLFERYQRVDRDAIKGIRGTGLGLYLVRGLVEAHGGRVWAESTLEVGSTFIFTLPKRGAEEEARV